jgi:site-specific recombinase XerD
MSTLREQMQADLQLRGITPQTQKDYLREVSKLAKYFNKSPEELGEKEVKEYLVHLLKDRKISGGTYRYYVSGIKFLYRTTMKREEVVDEIQYPKCKKKLPVVLDLSEVESLFSVTENLKHKAILMITYSSGLRISEAARLKITDIDSPECFREWCGCNRAKGARIDIPSCPGPSLNASDSTGENIIQRNGYLKGTRAHIYRQVRYVRYSGMRRNVPV